MERMIELLSVGKDFVLGFLLEFMLFGFVSLILATFVFTIYYIYRHIPEILNKLEQQKEMKSIRLSERAIPIRNENRDYWN